LADSQQRTTKLSHRAASRLAGALLCLLAILAPITATTAAERRIELPNGDVYEGEIVGDTRTGQGVYLWADQHRYEGEFLDNRMHGQGVYTWPDGRQYTGSFVADRREGRGVLEWPNGDRYEGQFRDNQMHGEGTFIWANEDVYRGRFQNGKRTGEGEFNWHTGEHYRGTFVEGLPEGRGVFEWPDGRTFEGQFVAGVKTGTGIFTWPNGNRYQGDFANDAREGLGTYSARDGTVYRGQFADDKMHGFVVKTRPDDALDIQRWKAGELEFTQPLEVSDRCRLEMDGQPWMFQSGDCINGLAHGRGLAASLDGSRIVVDGRFVLGRMIEGEIEPLYGPTVPAEVSTPPYRTRAQGAASAAGVDSD
jgi:hypothetical protein